MDLAVVRLLLWHSLLLLAIQPTSGAYFCTSKDVVCFNTTVADSTMTFEVTAKSPANTGWVAIGMDSNQMDKANIVMLYQFNRKAVASSRIASGHSIPKRVKQSVKIVNGTEFKDKVVYKFTRPIAATGDFQALKKGQTDIIWAYSPEAVKDENSPSIHRDYGTLRVNLFDTAAVLSSGPDTVFLYLIHGVLMVAAWSVFTWIGIYVARFGKSSLGEWWFRLHWGFMLLALALTLAGFGVAVYASQASGRKHFSSPHTAIGLIIVIQTIFQSILGQVINVLFNPYRASPPWYDKVHWWNGRVLALLAVANTILGILAYGDERVRTVLQIVNGSLLGLVVIAFVYGSVQHGQTHHKETVTHTERSSDYLYPQTSAPVEPQQNYF